MTYTFRELIFYLFFYGFLGWGAEVLIMATLRKSFSNRGFFTLPVCPKYGLMADLLLVLIPSLLRDSLLKTGLLLMAAAFGIVCIVDLATGEIAKIIWRRQLWRYEEYTLLSGELKGSLLATGKSLIILVCVLLLQPFLFTFAHWMPRVVLLATDGVLLLLLSIDGALVCYAARRSRALPQKEIVQEKLGKRLYAFIWKRLEKAYPGISEEEEKNTEEKKIIFARGICLDKLFWIFILWAFAGDLIETLYVGIFFAEWMSRSSVLYGTFSIVWGFGAVLMSLLMERLSDKEDRYVFLAGLLLGGVYEYSCSVIGEVFLGQTFWDYSDMPLNIGGRTNLLYCVFWGVLALLWVKVCYPYASRLIESFPPITAKVCTWVIVVAMALDMALSGAVIARYTQRCAGEEASNFLEEFIDAQYSDALIEEIWPNMQ